MGSYMEGEAMINHILAKVQEEVVRQLVLWGNEFDDKNTANDWVSFCTHYLSEASYVGRKNEYTPEKFIENMTKVAGLAVSAIAAVLRNGDCAPRHYEKQPNGGASE